MKKLFTLLTLLVAIVTGAWADDMYTVSFATSPWTQSTANYFTSVGTKNNLNTKFVCKYNGTDYSQGLKMETDTKVQFTTTRNFDVTIVRSTKSGSDKTIKFGPTGSETALSFGATLSDANNADVAVATLTDQEAGTYQIIRGSGEAGIVYVSVTEKGSALTKLSTPTITFAAATGTVTIGAVTNATKVTYTTDGTAPTAASTTYSDPFVVEDGTVVKAIAIGNGTSYSNSDVATKQVLLTGITIADPVVKQSYGTVAITCASPNATIQYSTDGGSNWTDYSRAFTLTANTDIKARASRAGCTTSDVVDATITAVAKNAKTTSTIVMGFGAFEGSGKVLTGKSTDVAKGYTLTMITDQDKSWSGREKVTVPSISAERTTFCGSNGVQCRLDLPSGVKATRLTLYSYVNSATSATNSAWKEVNGEDLNSVINNVPMGAFTDLEDYKTNPDLRVFPLDEVTGSVTFTNGGIQTCFVMELDIIEPDVSVSVGEYEWATLVSDKILNFEGSAVKAYAITGRSDKAITLSSELTRVPANTPILLNAAEGNYNIPVAASASSVGTNLLQKGTGAAISAEAGKTKYALSVEGGVATFKKITSSATIPTGKAYLQFDEEISAPALSFDFGGTTVIDAIQKQAENGHFYNLAGQRVAQPTKGLYIVNGKKVVIK